MAFFLKKLITQFILPPFNLLLLAMLGLVLMKRRPRLGKALTWSSLILLLVLATPMASRWLIDSVSIAGAFDPEAAKSAQAIVILGGGLRRQTPEYGSTPTLYTLDRVRYGATLAKQTGLPVLVTGGSVFDPPPEGGVMAQVLQEEFNVPVRWIENRARDTEENIQFSKLMLDQENIRTVVLVTHDFHMRRALAHCAAAGLGCIQAPVSISSSVGNSSWIGQLPNASALDRSAVALHEIFGNLAIALQGN